MEDYLFKAKDLCDKLELLQYEEGDILNRSSKAAKLIRSTLADFRKRLRDQAFDKLEDEVHFFKYIKPRISSYLIFFSVVSEIETNKVILSQNEFKEFVEKKERMFRHIMRENFDFVNYYRGGYTHFDKVYFLRESNVIGLTKHSTGQYQDPEFNTSHDNIAANILAFDLFQEHFKLNNVAIQSNNKLKWTASKTDLVELVYALQSSGAINNGEVDIKELSHILESAFQFKVGDPYRIFHDISMRKKEQVKFVNRFGDLLVKRIGEVEGM